jgi:acyl-CoA hydrolase
MRGARAAISNGAQHEPVILDPDHLRLAGIVRAGDGVMWGQANAEPLPLTEALMRDRHAIGRFSVFLGIANTDTCRPEHADCVQFSAYCGAGHNRVLAKAGVLDTVPCHYSQFPQMITSGQIKVDVLLLQLAPPDADGRYSLGLAHEYLIAALASARVVIAEVNQQAPWTCGDHYLRNKDIDFILHSSRPPQETAGATPGEVELSIARKVAALIEDGATLQYGIGVIPEAILAQLGSRRDLGIHSGVIGDQVAQLMREGVITNSRKTIDKGVTIAGLMNGSRRIHDYAHRNPAIQFRATSYTHDARVLASIDRLVALNSAIEVDLTGQVNAEVANGVYVGAVGGALDFLRGARASRGGLPIVALPSTAGRHSRIVARLSGPVSTPRSDAGLIVTEYGVADLRGLSLAQRRKQMLALAHPDHRAALDGAVP